MYQTYGAPTGLSETLREKLAGHGTPIDRDSEMGVENRRLDRVRAWKRAFGHRSQKQREEGFGCPLERYQRGVLEEPDRRPIRKTGSRLELHGSAHPGRSGHHREEPGL